MIVILIIPTHFTVIDIFSVNLSKSITIVYSSLLDIYMFFLYCVEILKSGTFFLL